MKKPDKKELSSFRTWLYTIGRNLAVDYIRKSAKTVAADPEAFDIPEYITPFDVYIKEETRSQVISAVNRLSPAYRQILYLSYFEGFTTEQTARIIKKSNHNVSALLYRAKAALKSELVKEGFVYEDR